MLNIPSAEADRLAKELAQLTGESTAEAVTAALKERLERERAAREDKSALTARLRAFVEQRIHPNYDARPVSAAEWNEASGDNK